MPLYEDFSNFYTDGNDSDMRKQMDESYRQAVPLAQQFWNDADVDIRFKAGDQTLN